MRVEVLSDHGSQQLQHSTRRLQTAESDLAAWQRGYQHAAAELRTARRTKSFWRRLFSVSTEPERAAQARTQQAWQQVLRADQGRQQIQHRIAQQRAGVQGEEILVCGLSRLSDDWLMLRGYRNLRGETDHILVGPLGVWAVEVKRRRIRLNVLGDRWWYEKFDSWGNVVETNWAVDGGGRNWGRQVSEVAGDLAAWLARRGHQVPVRTAVLLLHEHARLGRCQDLTVDLLGTCPAQLLDAVADRSSPLSPHECEEIARLIRRDHHFHNRRRPRTN